MNDILDVKDSPSNELAHNNNNWAVGLLVVGVNVAGGRQQEQKKNVKKYIWKEEGEGTNSKWEEKIWDKNTKNT